jgi:hypothetical protein
MGPVGTTGVVARSTARTGIAVTRMSQSRSGFGRSSLESSLDHAFVLNLCIWRLLQLPLSSPSSRSPCCASSKSKAPPSSGGGDIEVDIISQINTENPKSISRPHPRYPFRYSTVRLTVRPQDRQGGPEANRSNWKPGEPRLKRPPRHPINQGTFTQDSPLPEAVGIAREGPEKEQSEAKPTPTIEFRRETRSLPPNEIRREPDEESRR